MTPSIDKSRYAGEVNAAMDKALLTQARGLLQKATKDEPNHPDIVRLKGAWNTRLNKAKGLYETYKKQYTAKDYAGARETIESALKVWADSSTFKSEYARVIAKLDTRTTDAGPAERILAPALPPTNPCEAKLAGHGKRKKGTCFYFISGNQRGPLMVVVPAGGAFTKAFAIGKFEITVADYNRYCKLTGKCQPVAGQEPALPVTGISLAQAQEYVSWLSERSGQKYRLPTAEEWTYAASAAGNQPKKDYNCRVEQGGQLLKGQGTMGVNTGKANGWGLYNYVGNVQEWVTAGSGVVARGGAFEDTFSKCDISLEKAHDGSPDTATGFRVLLELG
jgi:formylglycine-generating enzyme required for sulfatase activity